MDNKEKDKEENVVNVGSKFIIISGVTSGLGEGMVRVFTKMGHLVAGFGRRQDKLDELYKDLNIKKEDSPLLFACIDITNEKKIVRMV